MDDVNSNLEAFLMEVRRAGEVLQKNRHRSCPPYEWFGPDPEPVGEIDHVCPCPGCRVRQNLEADNGPGDATPAL